ncbi:MAG: Rrf2 family transcriptional regulator [Spirochaetales bacterium]|nr:Rrf2 family transcriptional regulator [Spirochaetales bacterium]
MVEPGRSRNRKDVGNIRQMLYNPMEESAEESLFDPQNEGSNMRLSTKSEYAFLALIVLAENYASGYTKIAEIISKKDIPRKYLEQIMLVLKGGGFVRSKMGPEGGYKLSRTPSQISLAEIIRLLDGALAPVLSVSEYFYESSPIEQSQELMNIFTDIRNYISEKMENTTLQDLITG